LRATALKSSAPVESDSSETVVEDCWNRAAKAWVFSAETKFVGVQVWGVGSVDPITVHLNTEHLTPELGRTR
jgi:hypothetical protein